MHLKNNIKLNCFQYIFLLFSIITFSQNTIKGKVSNNEQKSIEQAHISIPELHLDTQTNENGDFIFNNLPQGVFTFVFVHPQYDTQSLKISVTKGESEYNVTLSEEHSHHIDEVIVSTSFNKMQSQNVMKVENKKIKEFKSNGALTLADGLKLIPGVNTISTGASIAKPMIRGLSGNRVLVYSQGVRLENQQFGAEHGLGLNDNSIESVEVIKGPASLLYGSDAMGGVLYFNPEKFEKPNNYSVKIGQKYFSNTRGSITNFGLKTSGDKWKFTTGGSYSSQGDYQIPNDKTVLNSRFEEVDFKSGIGYQGEKFSSTFRYNINNLNLGLPEGDIVEGRTNNYGLLSPNQKVLNQIFSLQNKFFLKNSKIELDLGYINNGRREFEEGILPILNMKLKTLNFDAKYYLPKFKNWETIIGLQGMSQTNENFGEELLIPNAKTNDIGAMFTTTYEFGKNAFQGGLRFDSRNISSETHGELGEEGYFEAINKNFKSFNAALGYKTSFIKNVIIRTNVASGFRAPNLAELTSNGVHEGSNRYEIGNSNLKNEQNIQTDINIDFSNKHFEFFGNGFYNYIKNYIYVAPTGAMIDDKFVYNYVQNDASLFGGESGVHFHPHPLDWLHVTSSYEIVIGKQKNGDNLPLIPAQKWNTILKTKFDFNKVKNAFISLNYEMYLNQNRVSNFETTTKGYGLFNFGSGSEIVFKGITFDWHFNINNLLDANYIPHLSRLKADGIPNMGRNFVFGIEFKM